MRHLSPRARVGQSVYVLIAAIVWTAGLLPAALAQVQQVDVFASGKDGYHTYRIPALLITPRGTVLAFCEGRKTSAGDSGDIDMLLKRSADGGKTFSPAQVVWDDAQNTCGNPCPILDRDTGTLFLLMTRNLGTDHERDISAGKAKESRTVWITRSTDDGITWSKPEEITATTKQKDWTWYATGPGAGIQTRAGRLIAPCDHKTPDGQYNSHLVYSDDHGKTWKIGGIAKPLVNECKVVELSDGKLLLNMRNYDRKQKNRAIATSADGGMTWSALSHDRTLVEPICQASLMALPDPAGKSSQRFLFSNPASGKREKLTLRLSEDDCKTWPRSLLLHAGPAAYSDLAALADGTILCLYERGEKNAYQLISLARLKVEDLK